VTDALLVLNAGSSSLRCAVYDRAQLTLLCRAHIAAIGSSAVAANWTGPYAAEFDTTKPPPATDHATAIAWLLKTLCARLSDVSIAAVGHRVVHGGTRFVTPIAIDAAALAEIESLAPLAPNHQPHNLAAIRAVETVWPGVLQVACFDTAFHAHQPSLAQRFALPRALRDEGIRRYGFHGLSYEYLCGELPRVAGARAGGRVILAHLGHGASLCAVQACRSVATTMGFSALDGLMMGTRCGAIDPGVLLHLLQSGRCNVTELADLLYRRSGLLGVSGISDDLRVLEASADPHAREAIELFAYRAACEIGALTTVLLGLDMLVFSAGIGEHSAQMRELICSRLAWLGVALAPDANAKGAEKISLASSSVDVFVVPTDEEIVIARATRKLATQRAPIAGS